jgi:hypothetical protein
MLLDTTGHFVVNIISISPLSHYGLGVPLSSAPASSLHGVIQVAKEIGRGNHLVTWRKVQ